MVAQISATTLPYCSWLMHGEQEMIEIAEAEDTETEKEDNTDEMDKKFEFDLNSHYFSILELTSNNLDKSGIEIIHHLEITTPPPEPFFFIG